MQRREAMKNNLYDLLNNLQVELPENLESVSKEKKHSYKESFLKREKNHSSVSKYKYLTWASILVLFISFSLSKPGRTAYANVISYFQERLNPIADYSLKPNELDRPFISYNKTIEKNGIKITIKDLVWDDDTLIINHYAEIKDKNLIKDFNPEHTILANFFFQPKVNKEDIKFASMSTELNIVNSRTTQGISIIHFFPDFQWKKEDVVNLVSEENYIFDYDQALEAMKKGKESSIQKNKLDSEWEISIPYDRIPQIKSEEYMVNHVFPYEENSTITLKSIKRNSYRIIFECLYTGPPYTSTKNLGFLITDEKGTQYKVYNQPSGIEDNFYLEYSGKNAFLNPKVSRDLSKARKIKIQPCHKGEYQEETGEVSLIPFGQAFEVNLD